MRGRERNEERMIRVEAAESNSDFSDKKIALLLTKYFWKKFTNSIYYANDCNMKVFETVQLVAADSTYFVVKRRIVFRDLGRTY